MIRPFPLLYLDDEALLVMRRRGTRLLAERRFPDNAAGRAAFADHVVQQGRRRYRLLVNTADEGFVSESLPVLPGPDQRRMIARRLAHHFPNCRQSCAMPAGRKRPSDHEEAWLLAALTDTIRIGRWLTALDESNSTLVGIHSVPFLDALLASRLGRGSVPVLRLTVFPNALRESFLEGGRLRFSRLVPRDHIATDGQQIVEEALRVQRYLSGQGWIDAHRVLPVDILAPTATLAGFADAARPPASLAITLTAAETTARQIGIQSWTEELGCAQIHLHLCATTHKLPQFADAGQLRPDRLLRLRRLLYGVSGMLLGAATLTSAAQLIEIEQREREAEAIAGQNAALRQRISRRPLGSPLEAGMPWVPVDAAALTQ